MHLKKEKTTKQTNPSASSLHSFVIIGALPFEEWYHLVSQAVYLGSQTENRVLSTDTSENKKHTNHKNKNFLRTI
jgi:hypothetical protein